MVAIPNAINTHEIADPRWRVLPKGTYRAHMVESDFVNNRNTNGGHIKVGFEILEGPAKGYLLIERYSVVNDNPQTVQIAYSQMAMLTRACLGQDAHLTNTDVLHFKPIMIDVDVQANSDSRFGDQNRIRGYHSIGTLVQSAPPAHHHQAPAFPAFQQPAQPPVHAAMQHQLRQPQAPAFPGQGMMQLAQPAQPVFTGASGALPGQERVTTTLLQPAPQLHPGQHEFQPPGQMRADLSGYHAEQKPGVPGLRFPGQ